MPTEAPVAEISSPLKRGFRVPEKNRSPQETTVTNAENLRKDYIRSGKGLNGLKCQSEHY